MDTYVDVKDRILVDIDNERIFDSDIVGLTFSGKVTNFHGKVLVLQAGDYVYLYTPSREGDKDEFIVSEGYIIRNPYKERGYIWCCQIIGKIEYFDEYQKRFNKLSGLKLQT